LDPTTIARLNSPPKGVRERKPEGRGERKGRVVFYEMHWTLAFSAALVTIET
jgi:hypothetical protein